MLEPAFWRACLVALVATVSWLAFTPDPPPDIGTGWDKANHAAAFAAIAFAGRFAAPAAHAASVAAAALGYGGFIEVVQLVVPGREGEWADLGGDAVGIALGLAAAAFARRAIQR